MMLLRLSLFTTIVLGTAGCVSRGKPPARMNDRPNLDEVAKQAQLVEQNRASGNALSTSTLSEYLSVNPSPEIELGPTVTGKEAQREMSLRSTQAKFSKMDATDGKVTTFLEYPDGATASFTSGGPVNEYRFNYGR